MSESFLRRAMPRGKRRLLYGAVLSLALAGGAAAWLLHVEGRYREAESALGERDYARAGRLADDYLRVWPSSGKGHFLAARVARLTGEDDRAAKHLRRCRELAYDPEAVEVESRLGDLQRGDRRAEPFLRSLADADGPQSPWILEVLIQSYLDEYQLDQALACLNHYLRLRPDDLLALLGRAFVWERFLYFGDALEDYRRAVRAHPESDRARLKLAETALIAGTPQEALEQFERLAERDADRIEVRLGLAQCRRRLGDAKEATRLLDGVLADAPDLADALWEKAQIALDAGEFATAEALLLRAERQAPNDRKIVHALARCAAALGRKAEAARYQAREDRIRADLARLGELSKQVMLSPRDPSLRCEMGLLFLRSGEEREGVRWLEQALRLDPRQQKAREAILEYARKEGQRRARQGVAPPG